MCHTTCECLHEVDQFSRGVLLSFNFFLLLSLSLVLFRHSSARAFYVVSNI